MEFLPVQYFTNYIEAHISLGKLKEEGFNCWLKDENLVTINPIWSNAVGGIKLMVEESQAEKAIFLLHHLDKKAKEETPCPQCCSNHVELVTSPRKASNWISAIIGFLSYSFALPGHKVYHCFDCGHEFEPVRGMNGKQLPLN